MKRIAVAGLLGSLVLIVWMIVINGLFGFSSRINMKKLENESLVYEVLRDNVKVPGKYVVNPEVTSEGRFPEGDPVFGLTYSGMGHDTAGGVMIAGLIVMLVLPMTAAWLLSQASDRVLASFPRKVFFFFTLGLLIALFSDFNKYGIDGYPLGDVLMLGAHDIVVWTMVGLVIAWRIKPAGKYSMA